MIASKITSRYAKALIDLAKDQNALDSCLNDMELLKSSCVTNHELQLLLKSPIINSDKSEGILEMIFKSKVSKLSMLFIQILTKKKENLYYLKLLKTLFNFTAQKNIAVAKVITATPLNDSLRKKSLNS